MDNLTRISKKICSRLDLQKLIDNWKQNNNKIVFTNGCFDIVHRGHIDVLSKIADLGDKLIIGLNSDSSIKRIKGVDRPIIDQFSRSLLLASIEFIDAVIIFENDTPIELINSIKPDILAKGGDYEVEKIVGYNTVIKNGGKVITVPLVKGLSTTNIINYINKI